MIEEVLIKYEKDSRTSKWFNERFTKDRK
jgi:hypothetical protein